MSVSLDLFSGSRLRVLGLAAAILALGACSTTDSATTGSGDTSSVTQPAGPTPGSEEDFLAQVQDRVFFGFDRFDLTPEARLVLERQAAWLKQYGDLRLTVEGHADERGTREYNFALGARRANAVKDYLISLGVDPARVSTISYGKERPVAAGSNEAAWRLNRRGVSVLNARPGA
jgi:peptidoglycan-associated lipoprotein